MLKNKDIIAQLTDSQKVRLLTSIGNLSGKDFKILGIDGIKAGNMKDYGRDVFPHSTALAHSWDEELWHDVASAKAQMLIDDGVDFAIVPGAKIKLSPYRREVTEDTYLAARFSASHASAAESAGLKSALSGYYLTESDTSWMDKSPSERAINEFVVQPYESSLNVSGSSAIMTDVRSVSSEYQAYGRRMQELIRGDRHLICESASEENTVNFISRGIICLSASANALESAMNRYKKLKQAMERGEGVTFDQIQKEEIECTAISDEAVDEAIDEVIEFIKESKEKTRRSVTNEYNLAYRATVESTVLLKNKYNALPLSTGTRIALIGSVLPDDVNGVNAIYKVGNELNARGYNCVAVESGYDMVNEQRTQMMERALRAADMASTVILFLGFGYENEKNIPRKGSLELPANQLRLADMLVKRKKNVIGILAAGHAPDVEFTRGFTALMMAPVDVQTSVPAIVSLLTGEQSPSGKLAYTLYAGSDHAFKKGQHYKNEYGLKSGPFIGYRYYDTAGINVGYPFGHGLSYSRFEYSDLVCSEGSVSFSVENVGNVPATEVAQVYIGVDSSAVLRPNKELCGFVKIALAPKEKKRVKMTVDVPCVYQDGNFKTERAPCTVYVGSSSSDIRLSAKINVHGVTLRADGERLIDYIQSVPNILEDNFTLEAKYYPMKNKSMKNILVGLASLTLAIGLAVFNTATDLSSVFIGVVAGILAGLSIFFFVTELVERSHNYENELDKVNEKNKEYFADAEQINVFSTDRMFYEEFDAREQSYSDTGVTDYINDIEMSHYIDADFKLANMAAELAVFCEERGMRLGAGVAENIVVSLAGSKLLILDGIGSEDFNSLMLLISEYFTTKAYIDKVTGPVNESYDLFFSYDNFGEYVKRPTVLAIEAASAVPDLIHFAAVDGLDASSFEKYVKPFINHISSARDHNLVRILNEQGANVGYNVSRNLKLVVRLDDVTPLDTLPTTVLRMASYTHVSLVRCMQSSEWSSYHGCNRYQLEYMHEKESVASNVSENVYKKIDKLESFVSAHSDYRIGNKLWLALEKQIGMLLSTKKETEDALDVAMATRLIPSMAAALRNNLTKEDETLRETIEFIFGDENVSVCKKLIESIEDSEKKLFEMEHPEVVVASSKEADNASVQALKTEINTTSDVTQDEVVEEVLDESVLDEEVVEEIEEEIIVDEEIPEV